MVSQVFRIIFLLMLLAPIFSLADDTYRVYDKEGKVVEIWKQKDNLIEVYNPDWSRKGYIRKEGSRLERYDRDWKREEMIEDRVPGLFNDGARSED